MKRTSRNPTVPLPDKFPESEYALLTVGEFLRQRDPEEKLHPSEAYQTDLKNLNNSLYHIGSTEDSRRRRIAVEALDRGAQSGIVFRVNETGEVVAVLKDGVLYRDRFLKLRPEFCTSGPLGDWKRISFQQEVEVKYPSQFVPKEDRRKQFPFVLRRVKVKGEGFEFRSERPPQTDKRDTIAVLNDHGDIVARGDDEWGATLLRVAEEYRGRGLGKLLAQVWYEINPSSKSGGFTPAGRANAAAAWEQRVREWLSRGWYSELVRSGRMSRDRARQILSGLTSGGKVVSFLPEPIAAEREPDLRLYVDEDGVAFVLYDARFLEDQNDLFILGYGLLRDTEEHGTFFYRIEYEPGYRELVSAIGLQLAHDAGDPLYVDAPPADLIEWEVVPHAKYREGYVTLDRDILSLRKLAAVEKRLRKDPYNEKRDALVEAAEYKW
jgi:hypothetical protein